MKATALDYGAIGDRIRALREARGLSQRDLGIPGATYAYISRIESGSRHPSIEVLIALAEKLGVTPLFLMTGATHVRCPVCQRV